MDAQFEVLESVQAVPVELIDTDPDQPRVVFDPEQMSVLKQSIETHGLIDAIRLRPHPEKEGRFIIHTGERRFRAHQELNFDTVKAVITDLQDRDFAGQVEENLMRADLTPLEEAHAIERLFAGEGLKQDRNRTLEEVMQRTGMTEPTIYERRSLLELPEQVQQLLQNRKIPYSGAVVLAQIAKQGKATSEIVELAAKLAANQISVSELREERGDSQSFRGKRRGKSRVPRDGLAQLRRMLTLRKQVPAKEALMNAWLALSEAEQNLAWDRLSSAARQNMLDDFPRFAQTLIDFNRTLERLRKRRVTPREETAKRTTPRRRRSSGKGLPVDLLRGMLFGDNGEAIFRLGRAHIEEALGSTENKALNALNALRDKWEKKTARELVAELAERHRVEHFGGLLLAMFDSKQPEDRIDLNRL